MFPLYTFSPKTLPKLIRIQLKTINTMPFQSEASEWLAWKYAAIIRLSFLSVVFLQMTFQDFRELSLSRRVATGVLGKRTSSCNILKHEPCCRIAVSPGDEATATATALATGF